MSEENKSIVRRYIEEGLNQRNLQLFDEILATDFANHSPRLGRVGREATVQNFAQILKAIPDRHSTIEAIVAEGNNVCVRASVQGTHQEEIQGGTTLPGLQWASEYPKGYLQAGRVSLSSLLRT